ncbi:unnamed protein product [Notodromas monacha]|uniref:protein-tyrosine-phosphatase n=1 Tax=Notodromas monacha TaxID=399045 RepID=A0A7R9BSR1_9CRUS|nr:unnamed protein product [Notodromas monacha]CAG0919424.1 unnamed protein product [Notodromas monacha]
MPGEGIDVLDNLEREFKEIDSQRTGWHALFNSIGMDSRNPELTSKESVKPCNRPLNRYRNVSPYDHSRIVLLNSDVDYINANLVEVPLADRRYILSQGPLENTCGHFWLMIWQQGTRAVVMLNRIVENNVPKCHQYWPEEKGKIKIFDDVGLQITLLQERGEGFYIVRTLLVTETSSGDCREVLQFHYTTWPDFQVPSSPAAFLSFLAAVRRSGTLENEVGPAVIHCSAGIGRSGTFCLIDSCLLLLEKRIFSELDVRSILLELRTYRMGLIQTADQLRFSFLGIIRGARKILCEDGSFDGNFDLDDDTDSQMQTSHRLDSSSSEDEGKPPTPPLRSDSLSRSFDNSSSSPATAEDLSDGSGDELPPAMPVKNSLFKTQGYTMPVAEELINLTNGKHVLGEDARKSQDSEKTLGNQPLSKFLVGAAVVAIISIFSYVYWM